MERQGGLCYYCGRPMRPMPNGHTGHLPADAFTFEHLDSRYSDERGQHGSEYRVVGACNKCNFEHNLVEEAELGAAGLRERAVNGLLRKYASGARLSKQEKERLTAALTAGKKSP